MKAVLAIQRGTPGEAPRMETFEVEFEAGQSVLDGLRVLRRDQDPSLAFRFSCINANACKECMMLIDGEVDYCLHRPSQGGRDEARATAEKGACTRSRHRNRTSRRTAGARQPKLKGDGKRSVSKMHGSECWRAAISLACGREVMRFWPGAIRRRRQSDALARYSARQA
ncbi:2Fe-2S iron-sulfur cluster-binding protein [Bradyrhizobium sp. ARR65]|uniref:2Fe-2S iron-sulfur cluster-binding protein n=1 Tax=Bradyrhizobium sp. ARR65 TaxID=1040989 RepID=UPI0018DE7938|nr:2Fe-2S iron-sulfur cluster-binding protein [Bradyrhizobium sp. ARR65]